MNKAVILLAVLLTTALCGCGENKAETVRALDDTLATLSKHGYIAEGTIEVDLNPNVYAKQEFGLGGRAQLRAQIRRTDGSQPVGEVAP